MACAPSLHVPNADVSIRAHTVRSCTPCTDREAGMECNQCSRAPSEETILHLPGRLKRSIPPACQWDAPVSVLSCKPCTDLRLERRLLQADMYLRARVSGCTSPYIPATSRPGCKVYRPCAAVVPCPPCHDQPTASPPRVMLHYTQQRYVFTSLCCNTTRHMHTHHTG
eukprot:364855-Chlamydomonas_euryale.AAC.5